MPALSVHRGQLDPDGDSVGSQLALRRLILAERGDAFAPRIAIVNQVPCPLRYGSLADTRAIVTAFTEGIKQTVVWYQENTEWIADVSARSSAFLQNALHLAEAREDHRCHDQ